MAKKLELVSEIARKALEYAFDPTRSFNPTADQILNDGQGWSCTELDEGNKTTLTFSGFTSAGNLLLRTDAGKTTYIRWTRAADYWISTELNRRKEPVDQIVLRGIVSAPLAESATTSASIDKLLLEHSVYEPNMTSARSAGFLAAHGESNFIVTEVYECSPNK